MARAVPYSHLASYTVVPLTSPWPNEAAELEPVLSSTLDIYKLAIASVIIIMIFSTIVGNALVCLAVLLVRKLKQPANFLIVSLAVADFFVGLMVMPLALVDLLFSEWPLGRSMCKLYTTADLALCTASIVNLCVISVDRYLVISRPLRYSAIRTTCRILIYIVVVWLIAALVSLSSHIISNLLDNDGTDSTNCQVVQHFAYQIYATIISFYGPTLIMVILNVKIWRAAKRIARQDRIMSHCQAIENDKNGNEHPDLFNEKLLEHRRKASVKLFRSDRKYLHRPSTILHAVKMPLLQIRQHDKNECKARKTLGVIMSVFIICWFPFFFFAILKSCLKIHIPYWLDILALWLGYSNSTLNPAIYCKYNKEFRVPFREMLSCRWSTLQNVVRQQSYSSRYGPYIVRRNDSQPECSDV